MYYVQPQIPFYNNMTMSIVDATLAFTIIRVGKGYKVTVKSDLGRREGFFELDPSLISKIHEIQDAVKEQRLLDEEFIKKLGKKLFEMLFSSCKDLLHSYWEQHDHLNIILNMKDPLLHEIPWELCYDSELSIYVGADSQCSLVRRDKKCSQQFGKIDYPLKVLVIVSSPMDLEEKEMVQLDLDEIMGLMKPVQELVDKGKVTVDFLERASVKHIQDKLKDGYHIVHFYGHGFYNARTRKGYLVIEDKARNAKNLEGREVALLFGVNPPLLVIFTACHSSPVIPFLLSRKVPAVLAMQYTVTEGVVHQFVDQFYSLLAKGDSVMQAVSTARSAVRAEEGIGCTGWFTPVLYMRADDLQINVESPRIIPGKRVLRHDLVIELLGVENFVGRRKDLWLMEKALLEDNFKIVTITGIGGIGKTALASKFVRKHKNEFRGVLAKKIVDSRMGVEEILRSLDQFFMEHGDKRLHRVIGKIDLNIKLEQLNECLKERYLIVLDSFELLLKDERILDNNVEAFLRAFLSGDHSSKIVITSRHPFTFTDERRKGLVKYVDLKDLSLQDTMRLLERLGVENYVKRRLIHKKIGGNPQFLEFFMELAKTRSVEGLLRDITPFRDKIGEWLLHELVGLLAEEEIDVVKRISAFRSKVDRSVFSILGISGDVVDKLVYHSLVKAEHGYYFMHTGVRQYVYALLSDDEKVKTHTESVKYYKMLLLRKGDIPDILEYHYHLFQSRQYEKAGEVVIGLVEPFSRWGYWKVLKELLKKTVGTTDGKIKAAGLHNQGIVFRSLGMYEKAENLYRESLDMKRSLRDEEGIAASLHQLGIIHQLRGEYEEAEKMYRESRDIAQNVGDEEGIAASLHHLGIIHQVRGEYEEAEKMYRESLNIKKSLGDEEGIAASLHHLGIIHQVRGEYEEAEKMYRESLDIAKRLGDEEGIAASLHHLGIIHEGWGAYEKAEKLYRESLDIAKRFEDREGIAASLHQLGIIHQLWEEYDEAERLYRESLDIKENLGDIEGISRSLHQLGIIHQLRGNNEEAERLYKRSLDIKENLGDREGIARSLYRLGMVHEAQGKIEEALENYIESMKIFLTVDSFDAEDAVRSLRHMRRTIGEEHFDAYWKTMTGEEVPEYIAAPYTQLEGFTSYVRYILGLSREDMSQKMKEVKESLKSLWKNK